jgi:protein-tyrosine phosphatase
MDDGAVDLETAIEMARHAIADGITIAACTPHIIPGVYDNTGDEIRVATAKLAKQLADAGVRLKIVAGADVHIAADLVEGLRSGRIPTLNGSRYFLLELPRHVAPPNIDEFVFGVLTAGYVPIITHPERLTWIEAKYASFARLARSGVMVQLTAASLTGDFGPSVQQLSERMLSHGLVHLLASDGHNLTGRTPTMSRAREMVAERLGTQEADHMVRTRPEGILQDVPLISLPPTIRAPSKVRPPRLGWRRFLPLPWHGDHRPGAYRTLATVAGLGLLLAGCVGGGLSERASASGGTARVASLPAPDLVGVSAVQTERVGATDTLEVAVLQAPELNRTVRVDASGQISLPLLGNVRVSGRTVRELEADLAARYGAKYLQSPQVTVAVKESPSRSLTIEGAVRKPGIYPVAAQSTLLKAIALSGGLDPISDPSAVMIFRTANQQRVSATFDMRPIRTGEAPDPDVYPGDVIVVGESAMRIALRDIGTVMPIAGLLRPF